MGEHVAVFDGSRWVSLRGAAGAPGKALAIKGSKPTSADLPATGAEGDLWITTDTGNGWIWDADATPPEWHDIGRLQGPVGPKGEKGDQGIQGDAGPAATVRLGNVATGAPGSSVTITNSGATASSAVFNFTIPEGQVGATGPVGPAPTMQIDGTTDIAAGNPAKVDLTDHGSGTYGLTFTIPAGATGPQGSSIVWKGTAATWPPAGAAAGHAYVIGSPAPSGAPAAAGHMVVYDGATWTDGGKIQGPEGPTAVSADAGNVAVKGTDGLVFVPAGSTPIATTATLGGVIVGSGLAVDAAGKISTTVIVDATSTVKGIVKLASADDITNAVGTSAVTPAQLVAQMATLAPKAGPTFTGQASFAGGTVAAPGITFSGDSNTGLTTGGKADELYISAGGRPALSVASGTTTLYSTSDVRAKAVLGSSSFSVHIGGGQTELIVEKDKVTVGENVYPLTKGTAGQLLQTNGAGVLSWANLGIDALTDVDTTTAAPTAGQTLLWDAKGSTWKPGKAATAIDDLTDVDTTTTAPTDGQTLLWKDPTNPGDSGQWVPGTIDTGFTCSDGTTKKSLDDVADFLRVFAGCSANQPLKPDGTQATGWEAVALKSSEYIKVLEDGTVVSFDPEALVMMYDTSLDDTGNMDVVLPIGKVTVDPNVQIDWGDGSVKQTVTAAGNVSHTYAKTGKYVVSVKGTMDRWGFTSVEPKNVKLERCLSWGSTGLVGLDGSLRSASKMNARVPVPPKTVTSMASMFAGCAAFNQSVSNFDTAAVKNMASMFNGCAAFNQSVSNFDTAAVTNMAYMFYGCAAFNQSVSNFDTAAVKDMSSMFNGCAAFNQSVSNFDTAAVTNMYAMFNGCAAFNQSVSNFDTAAVKDMAYMFRSCAAFNQSVSNFDTAAVANMSALFYGCAAFNQSVSNFNTSAATTMVNMFNGCSSFNQSVSNFNTSAATALVNMFSGCSSFNQDLSTFSLQSLVTSSANTGLDNFMVNATAFSTANLDKLLKAWDAAKAGNAGNNHRPTFATACSGAGGGAAAKANLQAAGWTFTMPADLP